jgi:Mechanosensitive ion channel
MGTDGKIAFPSSKALKAGWRSLALWQMVMRRTLASLVLPLLLAAPLAAAPAPAQDPGLPAAPLFAHLNQAIHWHRLVQSSRQWVAQPSEEFYCNNERDLANEVVKAAFAAAAGELPLVTPVVSRKTADPKASADQQRRAARATARADRIRQFKAEIDSLNAKIPGTADPKAKAALVSRRDALAAEADLLQAMVDTIQKVSDLVASPADEAASATIAGQIDTLRQTIPEAFAPLAAPGPSTTTMESNSGGLIKHTTTLFTLAKRLRGLNEFTQETLQLQATVERMRAPLSPILKSIVQECDAQSDRLASKGATVDQAGTQRLTKLAAEFRQISQISLLLRQESMVLDQAASNLHRWRDSVYQLYRQILVSLLTRVGTILGMLAVVFILSEVWGRVTVRLIQDEKRRRQFLRIRRFVTGILMLTVILLGLISDFSSLATFAGVITAGLAVALQTIVLSVAAYFFMIGRSGLRVGDRITISGVTGDVIHVGIVRFYLKELTGDDLHPTGRMAIFSNSVIFQHTALFRPLPPDKATPPKA